MNLVSSGWVCLTCQLINSSWRSTLPFLYIVFVFMLVVLIEVAFIRLPGPNWKDKEWKKEVREQICDFLCIWILAWSMLPLRAIEPPFPCWLSASWSTRKVQRYFFNRRIFLLTFPGSNLLFGLYTPVGQARDLYIFLGRKESCLQTRCRHVCFSYCNMMALSVNLNLWKPDSTCDMKNLFSTWVYTN